MVNNKERVSLQYAATAKQTRRYLYNITPIAYQIYVMYGHEVCIYTIFNRPKGIYTAGQLSGFCWPVHAVLLDPNQSSLKASIKYFHWRKYAILWLGQPNCFFSMS